MIADPLTNDVKAFQIVQGALEKIGVSESDKMKMFRVVAAVLHLGNVQFAADTSNPKGTLRYIECYLRECVYSRCIV